MVKIDDVVNFVVESKRNSVEDTYIIETLIASGLSDKEIQDILAQVNRELGV